MVDTYFVYVQVVLPRVSWPRPMPYEVNTNDVIAAITTLLEEDIDASAN